MISSKTSFTGRGSSRCSLSNSTTSNLSSMRPNMCASTASFTSIVAFRELEFYAVDRVYHTSLPHFCPAANVFHPLSSLDKDPPLGHLCQRPTRFLGILIHPFCGVELERLRALSIPEVRPEKFLQTALVADGAALFY